LDKTFNYFSTGRMQQQNQKNNGFQDDKKFKAYQILAFMTTALLYTSFHSARTAWAYSKKEIETDDYFNDRMLSFLDISFMLSYAGGLFYNGWLGDQINLRNFLTQGGLLSVFGFCFFAFLSVRRMHNILIYCSLFLLFGYGQSRGFPGSMAVLGNWIGNTNRGLLIGVWNISVNLGNIIGQQVGKVLIHIEHFHWSVLIFVVGGFMLAMTIFTFFFMKTHPREVGFTPEKKLVPSQFPSKEDDEDNEHSPNDEPVLDSIEQVSQTSNKLEAETETGIGFFEAWKTKGLVRYALIYACIKGATYGILFWLPNYLQTIIGFGSESANISATYEFGQFCGAVALGYWSDKRGKRCFILMLSLYIASIVFIGIAMLGRGSSAWIFAGLLYLSGFFFGGPEVIVGGAIASDLGENQALNHNSRAISTITGIIDGTGSIGAAIVQLLIPILKSHSFYFYFSLSVCAAILCTPLALKENRTPPPDINKQDKKIVLGNLEV